MPARSPRHGPTRGSRRRHFEQLEDRRMLAGSQELVRDLYTVPADAFPRPMDFCQVGNITYFTAITQTTGRELWRTDGTAEGTQLVRDIRAGSEDSFPTNLTNINGTLFFRAADDRGAGLWRSDGTAEGTSLVKIVQIDAFPSRQLTEVNGSVFFASHDAEIGTELWKSDGTPEGTVLVKDIYEGSSGSNPTNLINLNGTLLFQAREPSKWNELWRSDGTAEGTSLVKDIDPGFGGSSPRYMTQVGETVFFQALTAAHGWELWKTDGTVDGTLLVKDIAAGQTSSDPEAFTNVSGTFFFSASNKLWKSDGTQEGTVLVKDVRVDQGLHGRLELANVSGTLFFASGELWKSDGTEAGTVLVKDINPSGISGPMHLTNVDGTLFFGANDGEHWDELWRSDGSADGTVLIKDINPFDASNLRYLFNANGLLIFSPDPGRNYELWSSDGTEAGTSRLKNIDGRTLDSNPSSLVNQNGSLLFAGSGGSTGKWSSDGSAEGTVEIDRLAPLNSAFVSGKHVYWVGDKLYASAGTAASAVQLATTSNQFNNTLAEVSGTVFFALRTSAGRNELWKTDGTPAGTVPVKDLGAGGGFSAPKSLTNLNGLLLFQATTDNSGSELWRSDGTADGTQRVLDLYPGSQGSDPRYFTNVHGTLYFRANDGANGEELWRSDGTTAGTVLATQIGVGVNSSNPRYLTNVNGTLYFRANDQVVGDELWQLEDASASAVRVKDIRAGASSSNPQYFAEFNGALVFAADDGIGGTELWRSDGTVEGTIPLDAIRPGAPGSNPRYLTNIRGTLFFSANDGIGGDELWMSDGTTSGTQKVPSTISPAPQVPHGFTLVGGTLFYAATTDAVGTELFKVVLSAPPAFSSFADLTIPEDGAGSVEFSVSDSDTPATQLTVTATSTNQDLIPAGTIAVNGSGDQRAVTFSPVANGSGVATITLQVDDGWQVSTASFVVEVTPTNDDPSGLLLSETIIGENAPAATAIGNLSSVDPDAEDSFTYTLVDGHGSDDNHEFTIDGDALRTNATLNFEERSHHSIRVRTTDSGGASTEQIFIINVLDANDPGELAILGQAEQGQTLSANLTDEDGVTSDVTYQWQRSTDGIEWTDITGAAAVSFSLTQVEVGQRVRVIAQYVDDLDSNESVATNATLTVANVNDAPLLDASLNPALTTIKEDVPIPASSLVSSLVTGAVTDPDANALRGIAVIGAANYHGTWQFSTNGRSTWQELGDVSESAARLLPGWARVRFAPKADFNGTVKFYYRAWDQTQGEVGGTLRVAGNTGGTQALSTAYENASLTVTPVNDPPKLGLGGTLGYVHDGPAMTLAAGALVSDVDSANFYQGRLRVWITDGTSTSNRLSIGSGFTVDANNNVLQGTTLIGKRVANGFGTNELVITFNANATPAVVQQLVRAITFKTVGGTVGKRTVLFTVSDGDGGLSGEASKTVNVS